MNLYEKLKEVYILLNFKKNGYKFDLKMGRRRIKLENCINCNENLYFVRIVFSM